MGLFGVFGSFQLFVVVRLGLLQIIVAIPVEVVHLLGESWSVGKLAGVYFDAGETGN